MVLVSHKWLLVMSPGKRVHSSTSQLEFDEDTSMQVQGQPEDRSSFSSDVLTTLTNSHLFPISNYIPLMESGILEFPWMKLHTLMKCFVWALQIVSPKMLPVNKPKKFAKTFLLGCVVMSLLVIGFSVMVKNIGTAMAVLLIQKIWLGLVPQLSRIYVGIINIAINSFWKWSYNDEMCFWFWRYFAN